MHGLRQARQNQSPSQGDRAYGVSYAAPDGRPFTSLLTSEDGIHYRELVSQMCGDGYPTEATLRFSAEGTLYCLQRRDGEEPENSALLGVSKPPYTQWQWHDLKIYFGGPNFIQVPSGQWIAAGRVLRGDGPKTELAVLDVERKIAPADSAAAQRRRHKLSRPRLARRPLVGQLLLKP